MATDSTNTFHAGICMAGAVSAGAYTAGVMDYLMEVLEHWERAKRLQEEGKLSNVPKHNFVIEVLGGASAGGMTAAITAAAVQQDFKPVHFEDQDKPIITTANLLYNSWVNLKETGEGRKGDSEKDMMDYMLSTDDIEKDADRNSSREVRAGFNSAFIEELASAALDNKVPQPYGRPYIALDIDVFTTITNLRGFLYKVIFQTSSGNREHRMKMHRDYAFFKLTDKDPTEPAQDPVDPADATTSAELTHNGRIPVNFRTGLNVNVLKQAAMATGAFPVGLESRDLTRRRDYIELNKYLNLMLAGQDPVGVKYELLPQGDFLSLNVDGGVINNEPYELTQQLLDDRRESNENSKPKTSAAEFDSVVMMIDPFPNDEEVERGEFVSRKAWKNVLPAILSAMRGQLMMKDEQIRRAYLNDDYTRFLIMPVRENEKFTIACGSLGGFGGFFSKDFRKHDFFLGRRNCQRFLEKHFTVPEDAGNPILSFGYSNSTYGRVTEIKSVPNSSGVTKYYLPIIPDMRVIANSDGTFKIERPAEERMYPWPSIKLSYILGLEDKFKKRIRCVLDNITNAAPLPDGHAPERSPILQRIRSKNWFQRQTGKVGSLLGDLYLSLGKKFGKGMAADFFIDAIITDMEKRDLIDDDLKR